MKCLTALFLFSALMTTVVISANCVTALKSVSVSTANTLGNRAAQIEAELAKAQ